MRRTTSRKLKATPGDAVRVAQIASELLELLLELEGCSGAQRRSVYTRCPSLLTEVKRLILPPFPVKEALALAHAADWHLASFAGVTSAKTSPDAEHAAWARESLQDLERCATAR